MRRSWRARTGTVLPVLLIALGLLVPVGAKSHANAAQAASSQDRIIAIAEKRYHASVVRIEESTLNGKRIYVLRLLSKEGKVWTVRVDAETGGEL
jgi:uncharacterized membrane protein YkoI